MIERFKRALTIAVQDLYDNDYSLIERGGMEQACVSRIYYYLQTLINNDAELQHFHLDCEYNKNGEKAKWCTDVDTGEKFQTRPDMVLHRRTNNNNNKVVIEFKGWWNNNHEPDKRKLKAFTCQNSIYRYELGIFVKLGMHEPKYSFFRNATPT